MPEQRHFPHFVTSCLDGAAEVFIVHLLYPEPLNSNCVSVKVRRSSPIWSLDGYTLSLHERTDSPNKCWQVVHHPDIQNNNGRIVFSRQLERACLSCQHQRSLTPNKCDIIWIISFFRRSYSVFEFLGKAGAKVNLIFLHRWMQRCRSTMRGLFLLSAAMLCDVICALSDVPVREKQREHLSAPLGRGHQDWLSEFSIIAAFLPDERCF